MNQEESFKTIVTQKTRHRRGLSLTATGQNTLLGASSIPCKYQRVIVKRDIPASSPSPNKLFHQRSGSVAGVNQQLNKTINEKSVIQEINLSFPTLNDQSKLESSFQSPRTNYQTNYQTLDPTVKPPFGSGQERFDSKYDLLLMFNKSPGPGQYNLRKEFNQSDSTQKDTNSLNSLSQIDWRHNTLQENILSIQKSKQALHRMNRSDIPEPGTVFPKAERFSYRIEQSPGPTDYDPQLPQDSVKGLVKIQNEGKISIPSHVLNNPLNFVKPLIVNLYYKKGVPDVGTYDVRHPNEFSNFSKDQIKNSYKSVFNSVQERNIDYIIPGDKEIINHPLRPDYYETEKAHLALNKVKAQMPSPIYQPLHKNSGKQELPETLQQLLGTDKNHDTLEGAIETHPEYYGSLEEKVAKLQVRQFYQPNDVQNTDRFGQPMLLRKPIEEVPGPGFYHDKLKIDQIKGINKNIVILPEGKSKRKVPKHEIRPAPGQYRQEVEPRQISFHYWATKRKEEVVNAQQTRFTGNLIKKNQKKQDNKIFKLCSKQIVVLVINRKFLEPKRPKREIPNYHPQQYPHYQAQAVQPYPPQNQQGYYTKERIDNAVKLYEQMFKEYEQIGINYRIKHYIQKMPEISKKLRQFDMDKQQIETILIETTKTLMLDDFEIVNWVKFIDRFDFKMETFITDIFFIALATKLLLNTQKNKEPFEVYLSKTNQHFFYFNYWITANNGKFYQDKQDALICHALFKKLNKGLNPKYDPKLQEQLDLQVKLEQTDFNQMVDELFPNQHDPLQIHEPWNLTAESLHDSLPLTAKKSSSQKEMIKTRGMSKQLSNNSRQISIKESQKPSLNLKMNHSNNLNIPAGNSQQVPKSPIFDYLNHQLNMLTPGIPGSLDFTKRDSMQPVFSFPQYDLFGFNNNNKNNNFQQIPSINNQNRKNSRREPIQSIGMQQPFFNDGNVLQFGSQDELSSSYDEQSYSSESDQETLRFIQKAKQLLKVQEQKSITEEDSQIDLTNFDLNDQAFYYQDKKIGLPEWLHGINNFSLIMKQNAQQILSSLTQTDKEKLFQLLPPVKDKERLLGQIIRGDKVGNLGQSPLDQFGAKLQNNVFTKGFQQYQQYQRDLQLIRRKNKIEEDLKYIQQLQKVERFQEENQINSVINQLINSGKFREDSNNLSASNLSYDDSSESGEMSEEEKEIYNEIHAEFDDLTSGYTTISSNKGEYLSIRKPVNNLIQQQSGVNQLNRLTMLQNAMQVSANQLSVSEQKQSSLINEAQSGFGLGKQDNNKQSTTKKSSVISLNTKAQDSGNKKNKGSLQMAGDSFQSIGDQKLLEQIMNSERFKNLKVHKNQVTLSRPSAEWIEIYRRQEDERYKHPTRPWVFYNEDGTTSIVGPVIKKKTQQTNQKPRDHPQLYANRPAIVTLLCLARDAASRLPDGVGTRADILELIKQSQWLKVEGTDPNNLNNIVSGALDRLHYEDDPCVKYDSERKLWIYLHKNRTVDYHEWGPLSQSEKPNTLENNSLNPFLGTEREDLWKNTPHREKRFYGNRPSYANFDENDNSESLESSTNKNSKLIVKIRFDKEVESKSQNKRQFSQRQGDFDDFGESKHKRPKY